MNTERLLRLANLLKTVPHRQFDIGSWGLERECGFAGCAAGWALRAEIFKQEGFRGLDMPGSGLDRYCPVFNGCEGTRALVELFEIPYGDACDLFIPIKDEYSECYRFYSRDCEEEITALDVRDAILNYVSQNA